MARRCLRGAYVLGAAAHFTADLGAVTVHTGYQPAIASMRARTMSALLGCPDRQLSGAKARLLPFAECWKTASSACVKNSLRSSNERYEISTILLPSFKARSRNRHSDSHCVHIGRVGANSWNGHKPYPGRSTTRGGMGNDAAHGSHTSILCNVGFPTINAHIRRRWFSN